MSKLYKKLFVSLVKLHIAKLSQKRYNIDKEREVNEMKKIVKIDRYGTYSGDYMYFVHYENGDIDQCASGNLPKEATRFMACDKSDYQFCKNKRGEYFNRWVAIAE